MLNPIHSEALYSATYVDNYIDSVENLPDDVQRHLSRIRDIDVQYRGFLRDVDHYYDLWRSLQNSNDSCSNRRARAATRMQQSLIQAQELGDEKMQIVNQLQELIDHKTRQLDTDQKNLDIKEDRGEHQGDDCGGPTIPKRARTQSPTRGEQLSSTANGGGNGIVGERHRDSNGNLNSIKDHNNCFSGFTGSGGSSGGGGGSTPTSERSGHVSNGGAGGNVAAVNGNILCSSGGGGGGSAGPGGGNSNNSNLTTNDSMRSSSKRSRRRNENTLNSSGGASMELCGNESNSANEAGSNGGGGGGSASDRHSSSHKSSSVNTAQKKNSTQGQSGTSTSGVTASGGTSGAGSGTGSGNNSGKKKKRKARGAQSSSAQASAREETPPPDPIDPDEPTYCVCNQISFGEMILCDNDLCPIEWFHFSCVSLVLKPKGKWFCPNCRGDRPNVMKPKAQFLKELERYNKEKEEKT